MSRHVRWSVVLCVGVLGLLVGSLAQAAIPPLSEEERQQESSGIVVGRVVGVQRFITQAQPGTNTTYRIAVQVERVERGNWPRIGATITLNEYQPRTRPNGWAGPQGQNHIPAQGARVRVYFRDDGRGGRETLEPNGIDTIR